MPGRYGRRSRGLTVATCAVAVLLLAGTAVGARAHGELRYVALGDSYTAGPLIPQQLPDPAGCRRSSRNYPHLVAPALALELRDVSCSGATTADLVAPQIVAGDTNPPQLDAVGPDAAVVTVGVGGNDIGFSGVVAACVSLTPLGRPCQDRFAGPGGDEVSRRIAVAGPKVAAVLAEIGRRAPSARVYVVGYPAILPEHDLGCWPVLPFALADVAYLRDKEKELNTMLASQAAAGGAVYVDTYGPSVGHDACTLPGARWVEPVVPTSLAAPVHPNASGMRATAAVVARSIAPAAGTMTPDPPRGLGLDVELDPDLNLEIGVELSRSV